jgi:hypothetical protein
LSTRAGERVEWKKDPSLDFRGRQLSRADIEAKLTSSMGEGAGERAAEISAAVQTLESRAGVRAFITSLGASTTGR